MLLVSVLAVVVLCLLAALLLWGRPLLLLYAMEPVGGGIPALTAILILITPQMADMMAAICGGRGLGGGYDEAAWHQSGFGLATAFLGFQGWFWMRAALNARANDRNARSAGEMSWAERWAPRLVLLPSLLIALSPLIVAAEGRITGGSIPWTGVLVALVSTGLLFVFIWGRLSFLSLRSLDVRPLPRLRCARLVAAAPLHPAAAVVSLLIGVLGFVLPLALPDDMNDALHTAAAALLGMGCLVPVAAMLLAVLRDLFDVPLLLLQPARRQMANPASAASDTLGLLALLLLPLLGGWASEQAGFYDVARAGPLPSRPTIVEAAKAFAGCGYPVIAVIEGGASRSAAWGLSMMAALDAATGERFSRQLFAISSVSGGSLAAATYAMLRTRADRAGVPIWKGNQAGLVELARADLLSSSVFRMLTTDALTGVPTRAWALTDAFEHFWAWHQGFAIPGIQHGQPLLIHDRGHKPCAPHLLLNGTDFQTGSRVITSSMDIQAGTDVFSDSVDALAVTASDIPMADAVLNSASFPIISPPGTIVVDDATTPSPSVVDGGVFEAIGARTARELAGALTREGLHPIIVVIRNDGDEAADAPPPCEPAARMPKIAAAAGQQRGVYVPEVLTSLLGLNAARGAHGRAEFAALRTSFCPTREPWADAAGEDTVSRLLRLAATGLTGMDAEAVVTNICGLLVGAIETTSQAIVNATEQILLNDDWRSRAIAAAAGDDPAAIDPIVWEALRFNPMTSLVIRVAAAPSVVAPGSPYETAVAPGAVVAAGIGSAMFDPGVFPDPDTFQARPRRLYMHTGFGAHECLGAFVGDAMVPETVRQILRLPGIRLRPDGQSRVDDSGGPFAEHFVLGVDTA